MSETPNTPMWGGPTPIGDSASASVNSNPSDSSNSGSDPVVSGSTAPVTSNEPTTIEEAQAAPSSDPAPATSDPAPATVGSVDPKDAAPVNSGFVSSDTDLHTDVIIGDKESLGYEGEPKEVEVAYTYPTHLDPNRQADPHGIYLDDVQRSQAEVQRAKVEDREPDLENPPAIASTPLMTTIQAAGLVDGAAVVPVDSYENVQVGGGNPNVVPTPEYPDRNESVQQADAKASEKSE